MDVQIRSGARQLAVSFISSRSFSVPPVLAPLRFWERSRKPALWVLPSIAALVYAFLRLLQLLRRHGGSVGRRLRLPAGLGAPSNSSILSASSKDSGSRASASSSVDDNSPRAAALRQVGSEPRAKETRPPWVMQSRILRHISFFDVYAFCDERQVLGEGLNGQVFRAQHKRSGRMVAAKCLSPSSSPSSATRGGEGSCRDGDELPEELTLYMRMSHPNICRLLEAYIEKSGDAWLVMEYCSGGELFEQVAGTSKIVHDRAICDTEERAAGLVRQMAAAFRYIHGMGIVHRDNKLENWVFASPAQERVKLIDFGFATLAPSEFSNRRITDMCGTCYYVAPEVMRVRNGRLIPGPGYGAEVDIWALGIIMYMLVSGSPPFNASSERSILMEVAAPDKRAKLGPSMFDGRRWQNVSAECRDLIAKCLERDPMQRLTASEVQAHPWLLRGKRFPSAEQDRSPILQEMLVAGSKLMSNTILAYICGHLAQRMEIGPALWTELMGIFFSLDSEDFHAPRGAVDIETLISGSITKGGPEVVQCIKKFGGGSISLCRQAISALDLTGDGRLHFYEFVGALIASGRVEVKDQDVADAFEAFDVDGDGLISAIDLARLSGVAGMKESHVGDGRQLSLPIHSPTDIVQCLKNGSSLSRPPSPRSKASESSSTAISTRLSKSLARRFSADDSPGCGSSYAFRADQYTLAVPSPAMRFLSKTETDLPWQVERRFAFDKR